MGGAYTFALSPKSGATLRLGLTLPRGGDLNELAAAALSVPARLTDTVMLLPEVGALRLSMATHGQTGALVYRVEGGLDAPLLGDFAEDVDPVLRLNGAIGVMAGPTIIGLELVNLINPSNDGDASMVHTVSAGVRGDLGAIQPGVALTWPLDDDLSDAFGTILHLSVRVQLP